MKHRDLTEKEIEVVSKLIEGVTKLRVDLAAAHQALEDTVAVIMSAAPDGATFNFEGRCIDINEPEEALDK